MLSIPRAKFIVWLLVKPIWKREIGKFISLHMFYTLDKKEVNWRCNRKYVFYPDIGITKKISSKHFHKDDLKDMLCNKMNVTTKKLISINSCPVLILLLH